MDSTVAEDVGAPAAAPPAETLPDVRRVRLLTCWVSESSRQRLSEALDCELLDDVAQAATADLVAVSTRMPRGHAAGLFGELRRAATCPVAVIAHAGGEALAADLVRAGADGVLAEGNEGYLRTFLGSEPGEARLVEAYDQRLGRARTSSSAGRVRDPVTGLPTTTMLENRLGEFGQSGVLPRVGFVRVVNLDDAARRLSLEAVAVLRRRLAGQYRELCRAIGAELFVLGSAEFAFVAPGLSPADGQVLGQRLAAVTETFAPSGSYALNLAVGHAGPEVAADITTLRELANRALELAGSQRDSHVVSADDLSRSLASSTELEAALKLVEHVERSERHRGHGERSAALAADLARVMGFDGHERTQIRLAAHLHDAGMVGLPAEAAELPAEQLDGELAERYRRHPERGAAYLRISAGRDVAEAVRAHHERWDGQGFPDGRAGEAIPVAARIVAVACAVARWTATAAGEDPGAVVARLREGAGTRFDPAIVEVAAELLAAPTPPATTRS